MNKHALFTKSFWDRVGIGLSGLCAIHCLFFPVMLALMPLWPFAESIHFWTHPIMFLLIAPTVYFAVRKSEIPQRVPRFLYAGLVVIAIAWLLHDWVGMWGESIITMGGSALLITGHWFNYKHHQQNHNETCEV